MKDYIGMKNVEMKNFEFKRENVGLNSNLA